MNHTLDPLHLPLHGSRLIEASAGTGKTWAIAALYLRLILGHGGDAAFVRPLSPGEILVMTFTRAATRELSERIRARLVEAARCFRGAATDDPYLAALLDDYSDHERREQAAYLLDLAAESMDQAAIFTIDAWCQRMLREHAFDSGNLFDEELVPDESVLLEDAVHDYWRQQVYPLQGEAIEAVLDQYAEPAALKRAVRDLLGHIDLQHSRQPRGEATGRASLAERLDDYLTERTRKLDELKQGWHERALGLGHWLCRQFDEHPKPFNGNKLNLEKAQQWLTRLREWAGDAQRLRPDLSDTAWHRLSCEGIADAFSKGVVIAVPDAFDEVPALRARLDALPTLTPVLLPHAAHAIAARLDELKRQQRQFSFADLLARLENALAGDHGSTLRRRILAQFPCALVDEFQDTSPVQYRIFDRLYQIADNDAATGLLLIGDPKQSIYGFRGADLHSYLTARRATAGRHYALATNYRSSTALVEAVNQLFRFADEDAASYPRGAFRFRRDGENPLPFEAVAAQGRAEQLVLGDRRIPALTLWHTDVAKLNAAEYRQRYAAQCAEHIVTLLNAPDAGFQCGTAFQRLQATDIAILVRDRYEARAIRTALQQRGVASLFLSDQDSVFKSDEAIDLLRWLQAIASPADSRLLRGALATRTLDLPLSELIRVNSDELAWEQRLEQFKTLQRSWQRQGVLAMLRQFLQMMALPSRRMARPGGERSLTNLLHLSELLQRASQRLDGAQALIRWLSERIAEDDVKNDEYVLRLESDAGLVKVVTVHKSKGLEYPLVYLPFAVNTRPVDKLGKNFLLLRDDDGARVEFQVSDDAVAAADDARLSEDLRLLYVALTRARHALWLGVPPAMFGHHTFAKTALGYLLESGATSHTPSWPARLAHWQSSGLSIGLVPMPVQALHTRLLRVEDRPELREAPLYRGGFEKNWSIGSYSSLTRGLPTTVDPERKPPALPDTPDTAIWHRFPRGALPGTFLHDQLEWLATEGFAHVHEANFAATLARRCERAGWGHRQQEVAAWLRVIASTPLPPLGAALAGLDGVLPEMEFWLPSECLSSSALDRLCRQHLLDERARPTLSERMLHGMLKGYIDLLIEHDGRYWLLDYKSNALGEHDAAYHDEALAEAIAEHRYDVQAALYLLALHRLLRVRLGADYNPARHLGGVIFLFLRGIAADHRGCYLLCPSQALLDALESLLSLPQQTLPHAKGCDSICRGK